MRKDCISSLSDLVDLIDRALDGKLEYDLEWDDFVSWENANPNIERYRNRIADLELLFFSPAKVDQDKATSRLIDERNHAAAFCGLPRRELPSIKKQDSESA
jgi:hypothetical protein